MAMDMSSTSPPLASRGSDDGMGEGRLSNVMASSYVGSS